MDHFITNLGDADQIIDECLKKWRWLSQGGFQILPKSIGISSSSILHPIMKVVEEKLSHDVHSDLRPDDVIQSLVYGFYRLRTSIFVSFRGGHLAIFRPVVNTQFRHTFPLTNEFWFGKSEMSAEEDYLEDKNDRIRSRLYKENTQEELFDDRRLWFANNCLIGNIISENFTGDQFVPILLHMLREVSYRYTIPDCDFLVNTRDYPKLRKDLGDPDHFVYGLPADNSKPMPEYLPRGKCIPMLSFNTSMYYNDIGIPVPDDWKLATGYYFGKEGKSQRPRDPKIVETQLTKEGWNLRRPQAVFRGSSTGPEVTDSENQRLKLSIIASARPEMFNVGITSWAFRDKKTSEENGMEYIIPGETTGIRLSDPLPLWIPGSSVGSSPYQITQSPRSQDEYQMVLYVDGNAAAYRYSSLMSTGFCILKVNSKHGYDMWFYPVLKPAIQTRKIVNEEDGTLIGYEVIEESWNPEGDHIPIDAELEDLLVIMEWCQKDENREKTRHIAINSFRMYQSLFTRERMCQYMNILLQKVAQKEMWHTEKEFPVDVEKMTIQFEDTLAAQSLRNAYEREYEIVEEQQLGEYEEKEEEEMEIGFFMPGDEVFRLRGSEDKQYIENIPNRGEVLEKAKIEEENILKDVSRVRDRDREPLKTKDKIRTLPKLTGNLSRAMRELGKDEDDFMESSTD
jgi:hypothetical protein